MGIEFFIGTAIFFVVAIIGAIIETALFNRFIKGENERISKMGRDKKRNIKQ